VKSSALAAILALLLPCAAAAEESPEAVYGKYHQALRAGNLEEVKKYATAQSRKRITAIPAGERESTLALIKAILPQNYDVWGNDPSADGKSLTLRATGKGADLQSKQPETMSGVILMQKEGRDWKVEKADWQGANQRSLPPLEAAAPTAPEAPARVLGVAREPCVYKPVMTSVDVERCR
jgi:hypothetical protein